MSNRDAIKKLLELLSPYKKSLVIIIVCLVTSTLLHLCIPLLSKSIMDDGFIKGNKGLLIKLVFTSGFIYGVNLVIELYKEKKRLDIFSNIQYFLSEQAYSHLMRLKVNYFNTSNYTEIMNNVSMDISYISTIADDSFFFIISQAFSITGGVVGLLLIDYRMMLVVLLFIPLKYAVMRQFVRKRKEFAENLMLTNQEYAKWFGDTVAGAREIKLFGISKHKHNEFYAKYNQVLDTQKKMMMIGVMNIVSDEMLVQLLITALYIVGSDLVLNMELSVGSVFAFITYSTYVTGPISAILNIGYLLAGIIPSTKRYYKFMELEEEIDIGENEKTYFESLAFKDVNFRYEEDRNILGMVNLLLEKGQKYAFVGENGSGKSTILDLILRMYEPSEGEILLNNRNIYTYSITSYRQLFSVVSQDVYLFDDTVRNNICLYKIIDDSEIIKACEDSGLDEFSDSNLLDYRVGVNGCMLSGGQKQKIALARALVHERPIIIFDEATSNTDIQSEVKINELLSTRLKEKTVIIVTHRQEILNNIEDIYVVNDGNVKELNKNKCII